MSQCVSLRRLVFRPRRISLDGQRSQSGTTAARRHATPQPSSGGHAHAGPRRRPKEEAALPAAPAAPAASRHPEDTRCVVRVVTARGGRGVLLNIASRRAIRLALTFLFPALAPHTARMHPATFSVHTVSRRMLEPAANSCRVGLGSKVPKTIRRR